MDAQGAAQANHQEHLCDPSVLKPGDVLSRTSYMKVKQVVGDTVTVVNETGLEWTIASMIVRRECRAPDHHTRTEEVTRSELARKLQTEVRDQAFVVKFTKQPTAKRAAERLEAYERDILALPEAQRKKKRAELSKDVIVGEKRVLRGHLTATEDFMGRSTVIDLDEDQKKGAQRQVDHRTIDELSFGDVLYVVK